MNHIEVATPHPACILPIYHPARLHVPAANTDITESLSRNEPIMVCDVAKQDDGE